LLFKKDTVVVISIFLDTVRQGWYLFFVHFRSSDHPADFQQGQGWQQVADKLGRAGLAGQGLMKSRPAGL